MKKPRDLMAMKRAASRLLDRAREGQPIPDRRVLWALAVSGDAIREYQRSTGRAAP